MCATVDVLLEAQAGREAKNAIGYGCPRILGTRPERSLALVDVVCWMEPLGLGC